MNTLKQSREYKQDSYAPATKQAVEQTDENIGQANLPTFEDMQKEMKKYPHRDNHMDWYKMTTKEKFELVINLAQEKLNEIYSQVWADAEAAQDAYHASPEGKIVPFP